MTHSHVLKTYVTWLKCTKCTLSMRHATHIFCAHVNASFHVYFRVMSRTFRAHVNEACHMIFKYSWHDSFTCARNSRDMTHIPHISEHFLHHFVHGDGKCKWLMSHMFVSTRVNESCHTNFCAHVNESCHVHFEHMWMRHVTYVYTYIYDLETHFHVLKNMCDMTHSRVQSPLYVTYVYACIYDWESHITVSMAIAHVNESCHTYFCARVNESCHVHFDHIWMSHVIYIYIYIHITYSFPSLCL